MSLLPRCRVGLNGGGTRGMRLGRAPARMTQAGERLLVIHNAQLKLSTRRG